MVICRVIMHKLTGRQLGVGNDDSERVCLPVNRTRRRRAAGQPLSGFIDITGRTPFGCGSLSLLNQKTQKPHMDGEDSRSK